MEGFRRRDTSISNTCGAVPGDGRAEPSNFERLRVIFMVRFGFSTALFARLADKTLISDSAVNRDAGFCFSWIKEARFSSGCAAHVSISGVPLFVGFGSLGLSLRLGAMASLNSGET
jgi:hypothetical protein